MTPGCVHVLNLLLVVLVDGSAADQQITGSLSLEDVFQQSQYQIELRSSCGPLSLARSLQLMPDAASETFENLRRQFTSTTHEGVEFGEIAELAVAYAPNTRVVHMDSSDLSRLAVPAIMLVDQGTHCCVFEGFDGATVEFWDPATLKLESAAAEDFMNRWTGDCIVFQKLPLSSSALWIASALTLINLGVTGRVFVQLIRERTSGGVTQQPVSPASV